MKHTNKILTASLVLLVSACTVHGTAGTVPVGPAPTPMSNSQTPSSGELPVPDNSTYSGPITNTVACYGTEDLLLDGADISVQGNGVVVEGSCTITIRNSQISASENALLVQGNGDIIISGSQVQGARNAVQILGNGTVEATNTTFVGQKDVQDNGDFEDEGGNSWSE